MDYGRSLIRKPVSVLDQLAERTGQCLSWLNLLLVTAVFLVVLFRYCFNVGSIALQESAIYLHALIFLGASAYTFKHNGHVRVDVFYRHMTKRQQALVNGIGTLILFIPTCLFIGYVSWDYVAQSWAIKETSSDPGGLPLVFILKSLILLLVITMLLQGLAELLRALVVLSETRERNVND